MMDEEDIRKRIAELFGPAQATSAVHQRNANLLKRLYESSPEHFFNGLKNVINIILNMEKGNKYSDRTIEFFITFCSMLNAEKVEVNGEVIDYVEHPLLSQVFTYLLHTSQLIKDTVRYRSCELINKILDHLAGSEVSNDLCDKLETTLLERLQDPKSIIRAQAIIALHRLQDPTNSEDEIIPQFIGLMNADSFPRVRQLCIEKSAGRRDVIHNIIPRTRDVDVNVRLAAYKRLSNFVEYLKISDRRLILHCGFLDQSDKVRNFATTTLINTWLEHYENNILKLMKSIRLDADEKDIEQTVLLYEHILSVYLKEKPLKELSALLMLDENKLIPIEYLNWEIAAYWQFYVKFLSKNDEFEDELNRVLPEVVYFCSYVKRYYDETPKELTTVEFLERQFILKQFFLMIKTYDFADVASRQYFNSFVCNMLEKAVLLSDVIEVIISCLKYSIPKIESRCQFVSEIISEIMCPIDSEECQKLEQEKEFQIAQLNVKISCLLEEQNEAIRQEDFLKANQCKFQLEEVNSTLKSLKNVEILPQQEVKKKTDIPTIIKYLDVAAGLLLSPQIVSLTPSLKSLKDDVIQELLSHENDSVRCKAFRCYALCCIVDKDCASSGMHIFSTPIFAYQNGEECDTQTLVVSIGAVVDLLRIYGSQLMAATDKEVLSESMDEEHERVFAGGTSLTDLIQGLVDLMDDEQCEIQEKAGWGLCQLVLSSRIHSPSLISRLVLKWCNPARENNESDKLRQIIGFTLNKIPTIADCTEQLEESVLMTVKTLAFAPKISPLADVNIENIAKFLIALCKISREAVKIHSNLATTICSEIINKPSNRLNLILSKMLLMLDIPDDKIVIKNLIKLCDQIRDDVNDRMVLNNIVKFITSLNNKNLDEDVFINDENTEDNLTVNEGLL